MFNITDKNKRYQCPSEFGLYKCEETNDCYSVEKKTRFRFGYLIILLTSIIVLSSVCVVVYNFVSTSSTKHPRLIKNQTEINTTFIPYINISFIHEFSNENNKNDTEFSDSEDLISKETEPEALEYNSNNIRKYFPESNIPRPFIYENRDPRPTGFQAPFNLKPEIYEDNIAAENSAKPLRTRVRNIQDIIKLLTNQNEEQETNNSNKKVKINRNQKNLRPNPKRFISDPFFPYKPQNPSDINLLATNGFRFAPTIQLDPRKQHQFMEPYPNYERPIDSKESNYHEQPISVTLDLSQHKRFKKRKPHPVGFNNLYNQNQYFNPGHRIPSPQYYGANKQPYFKPWNNWNFPQNGNRQKNRNGVLQQTIKGQSPMIVHLNLYPKKRKPSLPDIETEESKMHQNCSDFYNFGQIKNTTEFNHPTLEPNYGKNNNPNVEIQKSIGFTIVNPNFSIPHETENDVYANVGSESQWRPIAIADDNDNEENMSNARDDTHEGSDKDEHYGLEVGEVNESFDETATLPLPVDLFQKYFNTKPVDFKYNKDWDPNTVRQNPNLVNHRASFYDVGDGV